MSAFASADWAWIGRQVGNHLWQSTLFAAVAGLLALSLRKNQARTRHGLWMAASVKFLVPFAAIALIGGLLRPAVAPRSPARQIPAMAQQIALPFALPDSVPAIPAPSAPKPVNPLPGVLAAVWFCGFAAVLANWHRRWRRISGIVRASACLKEGREVEALRGLRWHTPLDLPKIVSSAAKMEPGIFGIFRPVLWLPKGIAEYLTDAQLEAILAHELCHARRRDNLMAAIHMVVEAVFWFHPLVWWLGARLAEERERACDEEVVRLGCAPRAYSQGILKVCEYYLASPLSCVAGVTGGELKKRIEGIMANTFARQLSFGKKALLASVAAFSILGPMGVAVFTTSSTYGRPQDHTGAPRIRGAVLEQGTGQPIADAEISLYFLGRERPQIRSAASMGKAETTRSDSSGAFEFMPKEMGFYMIAVKKEGYSGGRDASRDITLSSAEPASEVRLSLARPGRIAGFVVDQETGKPVAGVRLKAWDAQLLSSLTTGRGYFYGRPNFGAGREAITGADGEFTIPELMPGKYVVEVSPKALSGERLLSKFSEDDLKKVDSDYEHTYWPGGHGADVALAVAVESGLSLDIGRIDVRKVPYHRVHVRLPDAVCGPSDKLMVYEQSGSYQLAISDGAPCRDMLISGFPPGASRLIFATAGPAEKRLMASVPLTIGDENAEVTASLAPGLALDGSFIKAEGAAAPDLSNVQVGLRTEAMIPFTNLRTPVKPDSAGKFSFSGLPALNQKVTISGLRTGDYVKEIRYNGIPTEGDVLPLEKGAMSQSVTIVVDDKAATIAGAVRDGDSVVSQPFVLLARWPLPANQSFEPAARATGDAKGTFQMTGIVPGEYRILALRSFQEYLSCPPAALAGLMATAEKVELGPRGPRNLTLKPTRLR